MSLSGYFNTKLLSVLCLLVKFSLANAAIQLQETRLVYPVGKASVALAIKNSDTTQAVAIESWVESDRRDITITPIRMIIKAGGKGALNIAIPDDGKERHQETLYWLDVKGTPVEKPATSVPLAVTVINRIKVFYRPQTLLSGAADAYKKLTISRCAKQLIIKNPTPYYISFYSFKADEQEVTRVRMIAPYEKLAVPLSDGDQHSIARWQAISDSGFHSPTIAKKITTGC